MTGGCGVIRPCATSCPSRDDGALGHSLDRDRGHATRVAQHDAARAPEGRVERAGGRSGG